MDAQELVERRIVTVLFADLVGFTTLSEQLDAEDVAAIQDSCFAMVRETIGRYGGRVEKFIGDAAMAVFGVPRSRDDDATRAVRAGLALVHGIQQLSASLGLDEDALRLRVGVNTGEAVIAAAGPDEGRVPWSAGLSWLRPRWNSEWVRSRTSPVVRAGPPHWTAYSGHGSTPMNSTGQRRLSASWPRRRPGFTRPSWFALGTHELLRARLALARRDQGRAEAAGRAALERFRTSDVPWWMAKAIRILERVGAADGRLLTEVEQTESRLGAVSPTA